MKSIVEEASSLVKAIEKGWIRAGKPQEFTVKVFEEAEKNFFGFTTKSAKVGILFDERTIAQPQKTQRDRQPQPQRRPQQNPAQQPVNQQQHRTNSDRQERHAQSASQQNPRQEKAEQKNIKRDSSPWSSELMASAHEWITDSLTLMGKSDIDVKLEVNNFALKLSFTKPVMEISEKEKLLFKSWAYLIMQTLRQKYKRPLKGLKVILTSE